MESQPPPLPPARRQGWLISAGLAVLVSVFIAGGLAITKGLPGAEAASNTTIEVPSISDIGSRSGVSTQLVANPAAASGSANATASALLKAAPLVEASTTTTAATRRKATTTTASQRSTPTTSSSSQVAAAESPNWAGYVAEGEGFTDASGSWTQPSGACDGDGITGIWVGLDGFGNDNVEQTGTTVACSGGETYQYAWYEMYPAPPVYLSDDYPVASGDKVTASVHRNKSTFTLTLSNKSAKHSGWTFTKTASAPGATGISAEWIVEAPGDAGLTTFEPLANFGTVSFTNCSASLNGKSSSVGALPSGRLNIVTPTGTAATGALNGAGNAFSVAFQ